MGVPAVIWAACTTLLGTVVLAPKLFAWIFERSAQLRVEIQISEYRQPNILSEEIESIISQEMRADINSGKLNWDSPKRDMRRMANIDSMSQLKFTNMSRKKIENITLMVDSGHAFYQRGKEKEMKTYTKDTKIEIGYLQPRHDGLRLGRSQSFKSVRRFTRNVYRVSRRDKSYRLSLSCARLSFGKVYFYSAMGKPRVVGSPMGRSGDWADLGR